MDEIEEIGTFSGLLAFCNYCGTGVDSLRRLVHIREERHRELSSIGLQCFEDRLLLLKGDLLSQTEEEFSAIKDLVLTSEKTLKMVSDEFLKKAEEEAKMKKEEKDTSSDDDDDDDDSSSDESDMENRTPTPQKRILKGVMRVGALANGLLLRGEREVELVILCEEKPTEKLLKDLYECFLASLPLVSSTKKFEVELNEQDSCFLIRLKEGSIQVTCRISLTCAKCRLHPFKAFNDKLPPDPIGMLPRVKCEEMLRASRRARWFESKCYFHRHSEVTLKILRNLCRSEQAFQVIDDWLLQSLFYKVVCSPDSSSINLIGIFQRFFECLSSGILLPDGPGLYDPCEREPLDLRDQLTLQQKLNITTTAQKILREIALKRLSNVLGLSREDIDAILKPPLGPIKRKNSDSGDGESPDKKRRP